MVFASFNEEAQKFIFEEKSKMLKNNDIYWHTKIILPQNIIFIFLRISCRVPGEGCSSLSFGRSFEGFKAFSKESVFWRQVCWRFWAEKGEQMVYHRSKQIHHMFSYAKGQLVQPNQSGWKHLIFNDDNFQIYPWSHFCQVCHKVFSEKFANGLFSKYWMSYTHP